MDLTDLTIKQAHQGFKKKEFSARELALAYLKKIKQTDKDLNAYLSVAEESALSDAELADKKIASGNFSELTGIPCAIKDAILVEGQKCTAASKILKNYTAVYDATVTKKLKKEGSVILGKTNTDEFTMGASTENSAFGVVKNPHDKTRVAGGSSGGSAAAVAAKEACFSLGSDTGGSIRLPASFCGIVGLNPTYGSVSRYGLIAHASSLDQIGPMTKNVEDCKIVFNVIKGKDKKDATSVESEIQNSKFEIRNSRIGVPKEYFAEGLDKEVEKIIKNAIKKAEQAGAEIEEISLPNTKYCIACYYIIVPSEASSNLARFDGIKYGYSDQSQKTLMQVYYKSRGEGFGLEPKRRIMLGTHSLSFGYYDAYYKKAQEVRKLVKQDFTKAFEKIDLIFCPVAPFPAFKIGEKADNPLSMYLVDIYTCGVKLAGLPGLSLPAGNVGGLPVGLQIIGNHFEENKILAIAQELENVL
ncbi:MAG: aspartyl/glutamyl-tRNA amidotransferase subunit A [Candidatus Staskawiczbacteria bacterium RIFOXYC1_FULL_37_43]|nr:MAG: aspartyl/glutamyl-tRNA amidotransferase subunit A [Candidatus Staskawiczbacteria bacterium RIFCSPHIGHO2_01_FULL_37_17]OGZ72331.1 MAG: aspartyl/glutamyl-tRNA amidotransferase subunit A [Candidatus Staskawiczbacteria bacterium RIFCSPLOWO2_01_FULL_37_19]OGZ76095.1 MAG: aspartyl/glutamyl-tRNA amidotransferase subunit A [Candidatus Staskawiczbacteria bacterium RIFOXYA1_FULL_37_15]OGZ77768.1 MAG: aspartyl/glutamyl-tRNA amidotransferase subunit A [Candidatus Staskawiczbacteria bacterium RIFOXYA